MRSSVRRKRSRGKGKRAERAHCRRPPRACSLAFLRLRRGHGLGGCLALANNAGVAEGGNVWDSTVADWEWVLGVNVWGVIHGVREERFYILTHPKIKPSIQWRMEDILQDRNPTNPMGG